MLLSLAASVGCNGTEDPKQPFEPPPLLYVTPRAVDVVAGREAVTFTALLRGASGTVAWSLEPAGVGALSAASGAFVAYLPPVAVAAATTVTLTARAAGMSDTATITVVPPASPSLTVTPGAASVLAGGEIATFEARLENGYGPIVWSIDPPGLGMLSSATGRTVSYAPPSAVEATFLVTLYASAAGLTARATIEVKRPPGRSLIVTPATAYVVAGSGPMTFTAIPVNAEGPITWSLVPVGVGILSATVGASVQYTPPSSVAARTGVTLSASAAGVMDSAAIAVWPEDTPPIAVSGRVANAIGDGMGGWQVVIGAASAVSDAEGRFTIPDVVAPYDVSVFRPGSPFVFHYVGLTGAHPLLAIDGPQAEGHVNITSPPVDYYVRAFFCSRWGCAGLDELYTGLWNVPVPAAASTTGTAYAFEYRFDDSGLTGFGESWRTEGISVSPGQVVDVALAPAGPATQGQISAQVTAPEGYEPRSWPLLECEGGDWQLTDWVPGTSAAFVVPLLPGCTPGIAGEAMGENSGVLTREYRRGLTLGESAMFELKALLLSSPPDGAVVSQSTAFSWTPLAEGVYELRVVALQGPPLGGVEYRIFTTSASAVVPDLAGYGLAPPRGGHGYWGVFARAPYASMDEWAATDRPRPVREASSVGRNFTVSP
ncbi:MAG TPA: carboxypeptidase-like regulatory domain-containing protein [Anaeromyxobacteraceae bacterium]|nr:carboxypeptidase-like regulatory domain-containing protein [Anaeromyxobacteraceae bacterium]